MTFGTTAATNVVVVRTAHRSPATTPAEAGRHGNGNQQQWAEWESDERIYLRCGTDGEQRESEQWDDGGRNGGNDHGDELRGGSDGEVRSDGSDL